MSTTIRLGTRASALALAQATTIAEALTERTGHPVELVHIRTSGDESQAAGTPIPEVTAGSSTGVFTAALRSALLAGEVDLAVHSHKDLPTAPTDGLVIAAVPPRADARDALVARDGLTLGELPVGSRVGTGSPRRAAQLHALGMGLEIVPIRGNVDTRIGRVASGDLDGVVLARAGLARLDRLDEITETLDPLQVLPAPAQGALALETRADDELAASIALLDDPWTRAAVVAERALLATLEGGCSAPIGALAEIVEADPDEPDATDEVWLRGVVSALDGSTQIRLSRAGRVDQPVQVGVDLGEQMLAEGARDLVPPQQTRQ